MGRDEAAKDMELEEAQGPGLTEAMEEEETGKTKQKHTHKGAGEKLEG